MSATRKNEQIAQPRVERGDALTTYAIGFAFLSFKSMYMVLRGGVLDGVIYFLFGLFLAGYSTGIWRLKLYSLAMARAYAAYAVADLVLVFSSNYKPPGQDRDLRIALDFVLASFSVGSMVALQRRRKDLN